MAFGLVSTHRGPSLFPFRGSKVSPLGGFNQETTIASRHLEDDYLVTRFEK
ncbi:MAG: hypothetical protein NWR21_00085 [Verrucomicrobiales bacterium]|jgi:hypothetical protein|nr:hypothetical protein [Verrucomicrobiales bacterium]